MKMTEEHFNFLKDRMENVIREAPDLKEQYKKEGLSKTRYAWDIFWMTEVNVDSLYEYLNDNHIHTALIKIIGEY